MDRFFFYPASVLSLTEEIIAVRSGYSINNNILLYKLECLRGISTTAKNDDSL